MFVNDKKSKQFEPLKVAQLKELAKNEGVRSTGGIVVLDRQRLVKTEEDGAKKFTREL